MSDFDKTSDAGPSKSKTETDQLMVEDQIRHLNLNSDADEGENKCKPEEENVVIELSEEDNVAPEDLVFGIDLLLAKIMGCLSMKDLKSSRLVCSRWNSFVLKTFEKRGGLEIIAEFVDEPDYEYDPDDDLPPMDVEDYVITTFCNGVNKEEYFEYFISFMNNSKENGFKFPCANYQFLGGSLYDRSLQKFLEEHGKGIKKLVLDVAAHCFVENPDAWQPDYLYPHPIKLRMLLTEWAPNIQYLELDDFPSADDDYRWKQPPVNRDPKKIGKNRPARRLFPVGTILLHLRVLKIGESAPDWLVSELKEITPNLVEFSRLELAE